MSNKNFFNNLKQVGRNNLEAWMQYMEKIVPSIAQAVVEGLSMERLFTEGMPQMALTSTGTSLNAHTARMYYVVKLPLDAPTDVDCKQCFMLVVGERKTNENPNPEVLQLLYTYETEFALHYRYGTTSAINTGSVDWTNYRTLLKGDAGLNSFEYWKLSNPDGTELEYWASIKGEKGDKGDTGDVGLTGLSVYEEWLQEGHTGTFDDFLLTLHGEDAPGVYQEWLELNPGGTYEEFAAYLRGFRGWTPIFETEVLGDRHLIKIVDWFGTSTLPDESDKPMTGYISPTGVTSNAAEATDFRGIRGLKGDKGDGWTGASYNPNNGRVTFASVDGLGFQTGDLRGAKGDKGDRGFTGANGKSAYQIWLEEGNTGSIQDFIDSFGDDIAVVPPKVYWGLPITADRKLFEEDIGLSFLVSASAEIELPAWNTLDSGWFVYLHPSDYGKKTNFQIVITTEGTDEIRGELSTISGDVKIVRSSAAGQFLIIGEVKYISMEDLQSLIFRVEDMDWTNYWYPNWFPSVQVALTRAKATANNPNSSVAAITEAYNELEFSILNLGIRIAYPSPYVIENGNFSSTNTFSTFNDQVGFSEGTHVGAGSVENVMVPEQPKVANTIIDQVINSSSLTPPEFLDGTSVFSHFNEVSRFGNQLVGMEFSANRMQDFDFEVNVLGKVVRKVGANLNYYTLGVKVYTTLLAGQVRLTVRKYAKAETPTETKEDYVEVNEQFSTAEVLRVGILVDQAAANLRVFSTNGEIIVPDDFLTSDASSGKFSTAFEQYIDSFGLGEIKSIRRSTTSNSNKVTFNKATNRWQLDFPEGTMDYAKARLSSVKYIESNRVVEVVPIVHRLLNVVSVVNELAPLEFIEPQRTVEAVPIVHRQLNIVSAANELAPLEFTEPQRTVEAVTPGNSFVKVVTTLN